MNKNIKELAGQADFMLCEDGNFYSPTDSQYTPSECYLINAEISKFAELIVQECMKLNSQELSFSAIERLLPLYQKHFGVEE
jgi:hypothetical protein